MTKQSTNNLPSQWSWVKLGDVCERITKGSTPTSYGFGYQTTGIKFIKTENIDQEGKIFGLKEFIDDKANDFLKRSQLKENDFLFSIAGTIGRVGIVTKHDIPANTNQALALIRLNSDTLIHSFVYYFLRSPLIQKGSLKKIVGVGRANLSLTNVSEFEIPLPPLTEQKKIVEKIEELFTGLDSGVASLKKAKEQLRIYRQSVLAYAFSGRLCRNLINQIPTENKLPDGWKWISLKKLTSILGDGLHGTPKYTEDGDYYFINGNNLSDGKIEIKANTKRVILEEYEKYKKPLNDRTIFVSINGTLGKTAFYNGEKIILGKSACYFNLKENADKRYVRYYITIQLFLNYANKTATGSTIKNVSLQAMREFDIPLPPLTEQTKIVAEIEKRFSEADNLEKAIDESLTKAEILRQSILKRAFEGKLI